MQLQNLLFKHLILNSRMGLYIFRTILDFWDIYTGGFYAQRTVFLHVGGRIENLYYFPFPSSHFVYIRSRKFPGKCVFLKVLLHRYIPFTISIDFSQVLFALFFFLFLPVSPSLSSFIPHTKYDITFYNNLLNKNLYLEKSSLLHRI